MIVMQNCRNHFYLSETVLRRMDIKKITRYLSSLEEKGDEDKIKHIKKLYQIYNIFYNIKSLIFSKDTFEYTEKDLSTDDFYYFLLYVVSCIRSDIIKFIDYLQDDKFDNNIPLMYKIDDNNPEYLIKDLDEISKKFSIYLNFKHFR